MTRLTAICWLFTLVLFVKKCSGLQVIHNNPNIFIFNSTTPYVNEHKLSNKNNNNENLSNEEEDDDIETPIENDLRRQTTTNVIRTRPPILKVYSRNVTVKLGQPAYLNCGSLNQISTEENYKIKSVIWTQELTSPRLLANNGDLFVKNERFSLVKSSLNLGENSQSKTFQNKPKHFDIKICPTKVVDTGWYSCYIVKNFMFYQNVKYYTYLNVIDSSDYNSYDDLNENLCTEGDDEDEEEEIGGSKDTTIVDLKSVISEMVATRPSVLFSTSQETKTTTHYSKLFGENKILNEDETNTNFTIKRQLHNSNYEIIDPESANKKILINEIKKIYSTVSSKSSISINTVKSKHHHHQFKEELNVHPKSLNVTEHSSFQFDCTYTGPHYLNIKLIWLKDNVYLDKKDNRIFTLDFKQNYTRISMLKFVYSLDLDTGVYTCVSTRKNLTDSFFLNVQSKSSFKYKLDSFLRIPFGSIYSRASNQLNNSFLIIVNFLITTILCVLTL